MDSNYSAPYINNNYASNQHHGVQNIEQLKQLIVHLDATRYKLDLQNQVLENKLVRLQELVVLLRRERDDAFMERDRVIAELNALRRQVAQQEAQQANIISRPPLRNKAIGSSPLGLESVPVEGGQSRSPIVDEVDWEWHNPVRSIDFSCATHPHENYIPNSSAMDDMIHHSEKQPVIDFTEDDQENGLDQNNNDDLSFLNEDNDSDHQLHDPVDHNTLRRLMELNQNPEFWQNETRAHTNMTAPHCTAMEAASCMAAYSNQAARILSPQMDSTTANHLPEPPEADPDVMLSTLPERGKFLEAVMHAGPLLNTLLLAGPLPQWRHPPPPLPTVEIPILSMRSSSSFPQIQSPHMTYSQPVTSPVSSSHHDHTKDPHQLSSSSLSKFPCLPALNSQEMGCSSMKFTKIH